MGRRKRKQYEDDPGGSRRENEFLLDEFARPDLRRWQKISDALTAYHVGLYFHLEAQRALHRESIHDALCQRGSIELKVDGWTRIVDYKYSLEPLSAVGSLRVGGRFNMGRDLDAQKFRQFPALYCANKYDTSYREKFPVGPGTRTMGLAGHELALRKPGSFSSIQIHGKLRNIFDLTVPNLKPFVDVIKGFTMSHELSDLADEIGLPPDRRLIRSPKLLRASLLDPNWRRYPTQYGIPANPQVFGGLLVDAGYEGICYPSTKSAGNCLAVFVSNLEGGDSYLALSDEAPPGVHFARLDENTWRRLSGHAC